MKITLFHSVPISAVLMVSQMAAAMERKPTAKKMFNIIGAVSSIVMAWVAFPIKPRMNSRLLPRNKSRPKRGCARATITSMPMAMTSNVWWIVAQMPKKNIAVYRYRR